MEALDGFQATIQAAIQAQVADIKKRYAADRDDRERSYQQQYEAYKARLSTLELDNAGLKSELEGLRLAKTTDPPSHVPIEEHEKVKKELKKCKDDFAKVNLAREIWESRYRHRKIVQQQWEAYTEKHILNHAKSSRSLNEKTSISRSNPSSRAASRLIDEPTPPPFPQQDPLSCSSFSGKSPPDVRKLLGQSTRNISITNENVGARVATPEADGAQDETETADEMFEQAEGADRKSPVQSNSRKGDSAVDAPSSPVVVAERSLKRKTRSKQSPSRKRQHTQIKQENMGSSPLQPSKNGSNMPESLDLDEIGSTLYTPKKKRQLEQLMRTSNLTVAELPELSNLDTSEVAQHPKSMHEQAPRVTDENSQPQTSSSGGGAKQDDPSEERTATSGSNDIAVTSELLEPPKFDQSGHERSKNRARERDVYDVPSSSPTEGVEIALPRTSTSKKKKASASNKSDHGVRAVSFVAEDGEFATPSRSMPSLSASTHQRNKSTATKPRNRLSEMLEGSGSITPLNLGSMTGAERGKRANTAASRRPESAPAKRRPSPLSPKPPQLNKQATASAAQGLPIPRSPPPAINPDDEPIRTRPLSTLTLSSFRPNPAYSTHAYTTSLRRSAEKCSRPGCTDRFCTRCKSLSKAAELSTTAPLDRDEEDRLLRAFLGEGGGPAIPGSTSAEGKSKERGMSSAHVSGLLAKMTAVERAELVQQAREQDFRNRFGRHRQCFSKRVEPPGFWDVDFPSTQEGRERKEEAERIERVRVEERYWSAAREGGEWCFADEV